MVGISVSLRHIALLLVVGRNLAWLLLHLILESIRWGEFRDVRLFITLLWLVRILSNLSLPLLLLCYHLLLIHLLLLALNEGLLTLHLLCKLLLVLEVLHSQRDVYGGALLLLLQLSLVLHLLELQLHGR